MEFGEHRVETHARETDLSVVYTIDPAVVDDYINNVEQLLARDKYKVVGIDLQYTTGRPGKDQKVVVAQLCVRHHVLHPVVNFEVHLELDVMGFSSS